ncbi:MAG: YhcB family protein, partial [Gammaproteobacteria bacterium]
MIVGIALGFSIGKFWPGSAKKMAELERERDVARQDLQAYREDVNSHFARTAELFDKVTADYRGLYEHLAVGARQLGAIRGEATREPLAEPLQRRLASTAAGAATAATSEADAQQPRAEGVSEAEAATTEVTETDESLAVKKPASDIGPETGPE